ncbi:MAG TPA: MdtA/MuxA family multidrug efflux RND transporter periplasmic adaptor subunit [Gammaproteobacteria bacterium]|nr:MdtA/MuxA family multidrug efflux RND transporter periplasmic adaptor subunit [Gammaproteobacteria bacterium]
MAGSNKTRRFVILFGALLVAGLAAFVWIARQPAPDRGQRGGRFALGAPMAVNVATAVSGEVPIDLSALGTITPLATVTVKTQISGQLQQLGFMEGQMVEKGQFLAQIDPRPYENALAQAEGALERDEAQKANVDRDLQRYMDLVKQHLVSEQQLATQKALAAQLIGTVAADKAQVAAARLNLQYAHIVAPVAGRAGLRQVDVGNYVTPGDPNGIVVITQLQPISAIFPIPEDNVPALMRRVQSGATLRVEAYDRSNTTLLATGALQTVDNQLDTTTGTLKLRALFDNKDEQLFPNQFVNIRLLLDTLHDQVIVPAAAIQKGTVDGKPTSFVYLVDAADSTVSVRAVTVGVADGERVAVTNGLAAGDVVVTEGGDRLRDGARVQLPGAPPQPGATGLGGQRGPAGNGGDGTRRGNRRNGGGNGAPGGFTGPPGGFRGPSGGFNGPPGSGGGGRRRPPVPGGGETG